MSEKDSDINRLADRERALARLTGRWRQARPIAPRTEIESTSSETEEDVADDDGNDESLEAAARTVATLGRIDHQAAPGAPILDIGAVGGLAVAAASAVVLSGRLPAASALPMAPIASVSRRATPDALLGIYLASRGSPKSRRTMLQGLERCARAIGAPVDAVAWHELRAEHTQAIRAALIGAGYGKATIDGTLVALRGILRYAHRLGFMPRDAYETAVELDKVAGETIPAGRVLSREEIGKLRAYCASETGAYGRFLDATFALLLGVGLRATEACMMPTAGYFPAERVVRVRRKRNKEAELPVDRRAAACLDAWLVERKAFGKRLPGVNTFLVRVQRNDWVRPHTAVMNDRTLEYVLAQAGEAAGVAHFTPHDLRRTFCTLMLDAGKDTLTVAGLMSHDDPKTTARYDRRGEQARAKAREEVEIW